MATPEFVAPKTYYVYTYAYPDGTIFYIGKGTQGRIDDHELEAQSGCQCRKCCVIRQIWEGGKPVQKRIVYETFDETEALIYEHNLIAKNTGKHLTNVAGNPSHGTVPASFNPHKQRRRDKPLLGMNRKSVEAELEGDIIGTRGASRLLGISPVSVVRLVERNEISGFRVGDVWRFYREDIQQYIDEQTRGKQKQEQKKQDS